MSTLNYKIARLLRHTVNQSNSITRTLETLATEVDDWSRCRPYSEIPGPRPVPILGNTWRFIPYIGTNDLS